MKELKQTELLKIKGGISGAMVNSIARIIGSLLEAGRSFGSGLRRLISGRLCPL